MQVRSEHTEKRKGKEAALLGASAAAACVLVAGCSAPGPVVWPECEKCQNGQLEPLRVYRSEWSWARNASVWMNTGLFERHQDAVLPGAKGGEMTEEAILGRLSEAAGTPNLVSRMLTKSADAIRGLVTNPITMPKGENLDEHSSFTAFIPVDAYPNRDGADWASIANLEPALLGAIAEAGYSVEHKTGVVSRSTDELVMDIALANEKKGCAKHRPSDVDWEEGCRIVVTLKYADAGAGSRAAAVAAPAWLDPAEPLSWHSADSSIRFEVPSNAYGFFYDRAKIMDAVAAKAPKNYLIYRKPYANPDLFGGLALPYVAKGGVKHFWFVEKQ